MATKTVLSLQVVSPILIVAAFFLGRFTAAWPRSDIRQPVEREHPAAISIPPEQHIVGFLDMVNGKPVASARVADEVQVSGWAACLAADSSLAKVEIRVDDKLKATTTPSFPRPDVAAAYGRPEFGKTGWKASFPAQGIDVGEHALKAIVTCSKGEIGVLPAFSLNITKE